MKTSPLTSFAPAVRTQFMQAVGSKLDYVLTAETPDFRQAVGGKMGRGGKMGPDQLFAINS